MQPYIVAAKPTMWAVAFASCCLLAQSAPIWSPPSFSLDSVATNLQNYPVPEEDGYKVHLIQKDSGCNCAEQDDSWQEEDSADVKDSDFQVAPALHVSEQEAAAAQQALQGPVYNTVGLLQKSKVGHKKGGHKHKGASRSGCNCGSKSMSLASSSTAVAVNSGSGASFDGDAKPTGIWVHTCQYSQPDLVFWRLTNTAYLRGGIVLKETVAYTDTCKMCEYNNVACNKEEVELTDGNCLCMWRMNGVEMQTQLLACSACVSDCIGAYRTFDLGKPDPGMQKGVCLRKKPHKAFGDLSPLSPKPMGGL